MWRLSVRAVLRPLLTVQHRAGAVVALPATRRRWWRPTGHRGGEVVASAEPSLRAGATGVSAAVASIMLEACSPGPEHRIASSPMRRPTAASLAGASHLDLGGVVGGKGEP